RYFEQAAALAEGPERAALLDSAAARAGMAADPDGARMLFEEAIALYEEVGDTHSVARVTGHLVRYQLFTENREEALERAEEAFEIVAGDEPDEDLAQLAQVLSRAYWFRGDLERASERVELALDIAEDLGSPQLLVPALRSKAAIVFSRGHVQEATA